MNSDLSENESKILKEFIAKIFRSYAQVKNNNKIPKKTIQKILYNVNKKLPEDSELKNVIPYYWFLAGPYSEKVDHVIQIMKTEKILLPVNSIYELYTIEPSLSHHRFVTDIDSDLEIARTLISEEINQMNGFSNTLMVRDLYDDAPLLFYPSYKSTFLVYFESFCDYFLKDSGNDSNNLFSETDILEALQKTKISLPNHDLFQNFNNIYHDFEIVITNVLNYKNKNDSDFLTKIPSLKNLANKIWTTYAYGARILEHDTFYDERIPKWENMFSEQCVQLIENMGQVQTLMSDPLGGSSNSEAKLEEDLDFKLKLAKSIGLESIPKHDPDSFDRLTGIIEKKIKIDDFDSVELIREVRGG